jgi:hypothetical protein
VGGNGNDAVVLLSADVLPSSIVPGGTLLMAVGAPRPVGDSGGIWTSPRDGKDGRFSAARPHGPRTSTQTAREGSPVTNRASSSAGLPGAPVEKRINGPEPVELWTPRAVGWASVLLGFPGGITLAALNWRRMGRTRKSVVHLALAAIGTSALFLVYPQIGLPIGLVVGYYLYRVQKADQSLFEVEVPLTSRSTLAGTVIAIVGTVVMVGCVAVVVTASGVGAVSHRGEVLFGASAGTDTCSPVRQTTVLAPTDQFFVAAVMRETVRAGAHVVLEIDGPGATVETAPVTVQPPFDCVAYKLSMGPLDPGTYVFRFHYDGSPGTPDLARGTLTIRPSASASSPVAPSSPPVPASQPPASFTAPPSPGSTDPFAGLAFTLTLP